MTLPFFKHSDKKYLVLRKILSIPVAATKYKGLVKGKVQNSLSERFQAKTITEQIVPIKNK